jgi:hypothetical protein
MLTVNIEAKEVGILLRILMVLDIRGNGITGAPTALHHYDRETILNTFGKVSKEKKRKTR